MDARSISFMAIAAAMIVACVALFAGFLRALRRAGSESRRRLIARAALMTWAALAMVTPPMMLAALDILPRWVFGAAFAVALLVGIVSGRIARRSTMRTQGFA